MLLPAVAFLIIAITSWGTPNTTCVVFQGHSHCMYIADVGFGPAVYDVVDNAAPRLVSNHTAKEPLVVAADATLAACWTDTGTDEELVYCGYLMEGAPSWTYYKMHNAAGYMRSLQATPANAFVVSYHDPTWDNPTCRDRWQWWRPNTRFESWPLPVCGSFVVNKVWSMPIMNACKSCNPVTPP